MNRTFILRSTDIRDRAQAYVGDLPLQTPPLEVRIARHKDKRTLSQNAKLWSIYSRIADSTGHDQEEIHDMMRARFLPHREVEVGGQRYMVLTSTSHPRFTVAMMSTYLEQLQAFCVQEGITEAA